MCTTPSLRSRKGSLSDRKQDAILGRPSCRLSETLPRQQKRLEAITPVRPGEASQVTGRKARIGPTGSTGFRMKHRTWSEPVWCVSLSHDRERQRHDVTKIILSLLSGTLQFAKHVREHHQRLEHYYLTHSVPS